MSVSLAARRLLPPAFWGWALASLLLSPSGATGGGVARSAGGLPPFLAPALADMPGSERECCRGAVQTMDYRNVVNQPFGTVANGPLNAVVVEVSSQATRAEARAAVAGQVRAAQAGAPPRSGGPGSALAAQADLLRLYPPYRGAGGRSDAAPSMVFDDVVFLRTGGRLVVGTESVPRVASVGGGALNFTFEGWTAAEEAKLRTFAAMAYPAVREVYGSPATSGTIRVVKELNVSSAERNGGGYYNASLNEIHLNPDADFPADAEQMNLNFLHLIVHAFHDDAMLRYDAWEEGFARAATIAALEVLDPAAEAPKPGGSIVRYTNYYLLQIYDLLNQPALGIDRFHSASGWDGMFLWRNAMAAAAWLKVYAERRDFFARFNEAYYAQFTADLAGNVPALTALAAGVLPNGVEGLAFPDWYRQQYVLDTRVTPGPKLFVYNAPRFATEDRPPSRYGWSQIALVHAFRTDPRTGAETPISGTVYPIAWSWQFGKELPLEPQDQKVVIDSRGIGFVEPTFFNIGDPVSQRVAIDYCLAGESVRTYLPVTFTGVEPGWNDFLGVLVGGDRGAVRAQLEGGSAVDLTVTQGGFGGRLAGGAFSRFSRTLIACAAGDAPGAPVVTRQVNTGYDYYLAILPVGDTAPRRLARTLPSGLQMLTVPALPLRHDPAGDFGLPPSALKLVRWDSSLTSANKYEYFPQSPAFRPGRGFWLKLDGERTLQVEGRAADPRATVTLSVPMGWNQIGSPWEADLSFGRIRVKYQERTMVSLATAMANGWIASKVWRYVPGSGYQPADAFPAWDACWLRVNVSDGVTLVMAPPADAGTAAVSLPEAKGADGSATQALPGGNGWRLRLVATAGGGEDEVTIGASRGATAGFDARFDLERPPALRDLDSVAPIRLRFSTTRGDGVGDGRIDLDTDVRALHPTVERWTVEARTARPGERVALSVSTEGRLPRTLWLRDLRDGRRIPLGSGTWSFATEADGIARWQIEAAGAQLPLRRGQPGLR